MASYRILPFPPEVVAGIFILLLDLRMRRGSRGPLHISSLASGDLDATSRAELSGHGSGLFLSGYHFNRLLSGHHKRSSLRCAIRTGWTYERVLLIRSPLRVTKPPFFFMAGIRSSRLPLLNGRLMSHLERVSRHQDRPEQSSARPIWLQRLSHSLETVTLKKPPL